ncbi:hypothetical protein MAPG_09549 [Magnaporthiopsis poae ATCC 64411]|uniref:Protein kinase domain-containing protein n=1 Tax=Magnaporthiopsis poae (strain ATCC 64411 / 73-15) TaxID=644358 RepID=A0A0C4EA90_MAGP6|nr:hypothetical protein MAPG_09549 [Magnaporthiopsis poae ATCC 64411]
MGTKRVPRPFHTDEPMIGPPNYAFDSLRRPRLRKSLFEIEDIRWLQHLGGGIDGYCWKVAFGDKGPYVVKMFWEDKDPSGFLYWAAEREFQNAAVLQMIEASVSDHGDAWVLEEPENGMEAIENLYAFSEEGRRKSRIPAGMDGTTRQGVCRTRKCFGWLKLNSNSFGHWKNKPRPVQIDKWRRDSPYPGHEYFAIVYEYIEEDELDEENSAEQKEANRRRIGVAMESLWRAGFEFHDTTILDNWKNGMLIDLCDIVYPYGLGRHLTGFRLKGNANALKRQAPTC